MLEFLGLSLPASNPLRNPHNRRLFIYGGVALVAGGLAYQAYRKDAVNRSRAYFARLHAALQRYADALSTGGEVIDTLLKDLQAYLGSDSDEIPPSLAQLAKLLRSQEVLATTSSTLSAVYRGISGVESAVECP
jgi:hypothetical protein